MLDPAGFLLAAAVIGGGLLIIPIDKRWAARQLAKRNQAHLVRRKAGRW